MANVHIRPFTPSDLLGFSVQPEQLAELPGDAGDTAATILSLVSGPISVVAPSGAVLVVGGMRDDLAGFVTALIAADAGPWMVGVVRVLRRWFATRGREVIGLTVRPDFAAGLRFAELLGFERGDDVPGLGPNGEDYSVFVWERP